MASKKLPPLNELFCRPCPVGDVRPENAAGFACGWEEKESELNASFMPPIDGALC